MQSDSPVRILRKDPGSTKKTSSNFWPISKSFAIVPVNSKTWDEMSLKGSAKRTIHLEAQIVLCYFIACLKMKVRILSQGLVQGMLPE